MSPFAHTFAGASPVDVPLSEGSAWSVDVLRSVWEHQHDRVYGRIGLIERAIAALADGRLEADLRREAERAAHMLAGSLGMFGFADASAASHELELGLAHPTPDRAPELAELLARVRAGVRGPIAFGAPSPLSAPSGLDRHDLIEVEQIE
jgi:HPt (histidine-containing phosphotransfer) domain-containing protein